MISSRKYKVIALSIGDALAKFIGIAVMMLMARLLVKEDVAAYRQTLLAYATLGPLLSLGVGQGMYYFLPGEKLRIRGRVLDGIVITAIMGCLFAMALALGGNELLARRFSNPKVANMLLWMIPYAIITTPARLYSSVLVSQNHVTTSAVFSVIQQFIIGGATVVPMVLWQTAESSLIGNVVASTLMGLASISLMIRSTPADSLMPNFKATRELVSFTLPLALGSMFATISMQLDKLIVSFMSSPQEFAVYAMGAMEIPLIGVITGAITSIALADMRRSIVAENPEEALRLFRQVAEKSSLIILPVMVFLLITADTVMTYLYTVDYVDSAFPFRIYLLLLPIRTVVFGSIIVALGKSRFILFRSIIGLLLNIVLSIIFVWIWGPWGAAVATVSIIYLWAVPSSVYVIAQEMGRSWKSILPIQEMGKVLTQLVPLVIASLLIVGAVRNIHIEFALILVIYSTFLLIYWNNRLYSRQQILKRFSYSSKSDK